jgi:hypothetical protein
MYVVYIWLRINELKWKFRGKESVDIGSVLVCER